MNLRQFLQGKTTPHLLKTFLIYGFIALSIIATKVVIARLYGQEELGIFSYFFSVVTVAFLFSSFGLPEAVTQLMVRQPERMRAAVRKAALLMIPSTIGVSLMVLIWGDAWTIDYRQFIAYMISYTLFYLMYSVFRGEKRFVEGSLYSLINRLLFIGAVILLWRAHAPFSWVLFALSAALLVATVISFPRLRLLWRKESLSAKVSSPELLSLGFSLFLMQAGFYLLRETDIILIPHLVDFAQLGLYSAHSSFANIIRLIAYVFPVVVLPMAAVSSYKLRASLMKISLVLVPFSLLILGASYVFVPLLYGAAYQDKLLPLALVFSSALLVVYAYVNSVLVGENKVSGYYLKILAADFFLTLIGNTGLTILFVDWWGIVGAPIATSVVVLFKIALNMVAIHRLRLVTKKDTPFLPASL